MAQRRVRLPIVGQMQRQDGITDQVSKVSNFTHGQERVQPGYPERIRKDVGQSQLLQL
jgi:hypothetical protein